MTVQELRKSFLDFFRQRGHLQMPSAPLVLDDPTTLFTSAGMQPYIKMFRGEEEPPAKRVVSIQKCARTGDLDNVGRYNRYHTFFEMLGNFSFGDYFKKEAIEWGWEFITDPAYMGLDKADLWITVYTTDDEAEELWNKHIGVPLERIKRMGREDNWWPKARWEGPCGPCSEIHIDLGPEVGCKQPECGIGCDCDRYLEVWNLVFQMYTEAEDGALSNLPAPGVDTGMGLERLALIMQGKRFTTETDELARIMGRALEEINAQRSAALTYGDGWDTDVALRVITDHVRAAAFLMADNAIPAREGPGYVLRRLIRRAMVKASRLGAEKPFLNRVLPTVVDVMGEGYPELALKRDYMARILAAEEERFTATLAQGLTRLENIAAHGERQGETVIGGRDAFVLYDTYGFPLELTIEVAQERGLSVDAEGFAAEMQAQRARSSAGAKGLALHDAVPTVGMREFGGDLQSATEFVGYDLLSADATVLRIVGAGDVGPPEAAGPGVILAPDGSVVDGSASAGQEARAVLDRTPFYAQIGGQVGDSGELTWDGGRMVVSDTVYMGGARVHRGMIVEGTLKDGDRVTAHVDEDRRWDIMRHHTATHLLQSALRKVLGEHVSQAGSHVDENRTRFDFTHHEALTDEEIAAAEDFVNRWTLADLPVVPEEMGINEAIARGATALFGEKYGDTVRLVDIPGASMELCGGTHVNRTGTIGAFRIISQESVAAGIRRVEAVAGMVAVRRDRERERRVAALAHRFGVREEEIGERVAGLEERIKQLEGEVKAARQMRATADVGELVAGAEEIGPAKLVAKVVADVDREMLMALADEIAGRMADAVVLLGTVAEGKVALVCKVSDSLVGKGAHAGNLMKVVAGIVGGGGGGKPQFAQAGGRDPEKLGEAIAAGAGALKEQMGVPGEN